MYVYVYTYICSSCRFSVTGNSVVHGFLKFSMEQHSSFSIEMYYRRDSLALLQYISMRKIQFLNSVSPLISLIFEIFFFRA